MNATIRALGLFLLLAPLLCWRGAGLPGTATDGPAGRWVLAVRAADWGGRDAGATVVHRHEMLLLGGWTFRKQWQLQFRGLRRPLYRRTFEHDLSDSWVSPDGRHWTRIIPPFRMGMYGLAASFRDTLLFMGGLTDPRTATERISSAVWWSPDGRTWRTAVDSAPWGPRIGAVLLEHEARLWILGGKRHNDADPSSRLNDVWSSSNGRDWDLVLGAAPWDPRAFHCGASFNGRMWILGGGDWDARKGTNDVWSTADGVTWTRHPRPPWRGRIWHSCVAYGGRLWILGGRVVDPVQTVAEAWTTSDGNTWHRVALPSTLDPRHAAYASVFRDTLWWMGGSADAHLPADAWVFANDAKFRVPPSSRPPRQ